MPNFTDGVKSMAVWRHLGLSALSRLRKRTPPFWFPTIWQLLRREGLHVDHRRVYPHLSWERSGHKADNAVRAGKRPSVVAPPDDIQSDLIDGFLNGRTGLRSQDQVPYLRG